MRPYEEDIQLSRPTKPRRLPFGDLSKDRGRDRLFTIGLAFGLLLGLPVENTTAQIVMAIVAVCIIVVRTAAQYRHPDRDAPSRR